MQALVAPFVCRVLGVLGFLLCVAGSALGQVTGPIIFQSPSPWLVTHEVSAGFDLWGVASGPAGVVAVGTGGTILHSRSGGKFTWTRQSVATTEWLTAAAYGNGRYLVVGDHGVIFTSTDAVAWQQVSQTATTQRLNNIVYAAGKFVAVGEGGTILYSPDGTTWTLAASGTTRWLRGLAYGRAHEFIEPVFSQSCWMATGQGGAVLLSEDGVAWHTFASGTTSDLEVATFSSSVHSHPVSGPGGGGISFLAAGGEGTFLRLSVNAGDSIPLENRTLASGAVGTGVTARFRALASGARGFNSYFRSGILSNGEEYATPVVALSEAGDIFTNYSMDGSGPWTRETLPAAASLRAIAYSAELESFFAVGAGETIVQRDQVYNGGLGNISTRGLVDSAGTVLTAGFVIRGTKGKQVLLRGIGPALKAFGVSNAVAATTLEVYDSTGRVIASNTGWGRQADPIPAMLFGNRTGAFALESGSADSALALSLSPGVYTARVSGAGGAAGVALVEIYDVDGPVSGYSRAINLSTSGPVRTGENVLTAGVSVRGPAWRRFLVRGAGPSLTRFGVPQSLADPVLRLASSQPVGGAVVSSGVRVNSDAAEIAAATTAVGAFVFDAGARDAAFIVTLPPGDYTFELTSASGANGNALIEVYEIDIPKP